MLLGGILQFMIITVCVVQHHYVWAKRMLISSRSCARACVCVIHPSLPSLQRSTSKPLWWGWCLATINTQPFVCVCGPDCFQIHDLFLRGRWSREDTWPLISMKFSLFFPFIYLFEIRGNVINVFNLKYWIFFLFCGTLCQHVWPVFLAVSRSPSLHWLLCLCGEKRIFKGQSKHAPMWNGINYKKTCLVKVTQKS